VNQAKAEKKVYENCAIKFVKVQELNINRIMASLAHPHQVYGFGLPNGLDIPAGDFAPQSNHSPNDSHHIKRNGLSFSASLGQHNMMGHTGMPQSGMPGMGGPGQDGHIKRPMNAFMVGFKN
jgi:hypothetical protein